MSLHDGLQDGDEEVEELLPIFDPELPSKVRERLSRAPERLVPAEKKPTRVKPQNADPLSSATKVVMAVCLLALTALVTALVAWLAAALMPLLVGLSALLLLVGIVAGFVAGGVGWTDCSGPRGCNHRCRPVAGTGRSCCSTVGSYRPVRDSGHDQGGLRRCPRQPPQANHHRYLLPADFDTHGRALLLRVQRTRHLVKKASKVLGGCFRQRAGDDAAA